MKKRELLNLITNEWSKVEFKYGHQKTEDTVEYIIDRAIELGMVYKPTCIISVVEGVENVQSCTTGKIVSEWDNE